MKAVLKVRHLRLRSQKILVCDDTVVMMLSRASLSFPPRFLFEFPHECQDVKLLVFLVPEAGEGASDSQNLLIFVFFDDPQIF